MVECSECQAPYDSNDNAFCPRCGAIGAKPSSLTPAAVAGRAGPRRRRVQAAGVVSLTIGSLMAILFGITLANAGAILEEALPLIADEAGGDLSVQVLQAGEPVANATVWIFTLEGGNYLNGTTDGTGHARFALAEHMVVNATVAGPDGEISRRIVVLPGQEGQLQLDLDGPATSQKTAGLSQLVTAIRVLAGVFLAAAVLNMVGGIQAMRTRGRSIAIAGTSVGGIAPLMLSFAVPTLGSFLLLSLVAVSVGLMVANRDQFQS